MGFTVAVAVSGGADSVCLLRALDHLKRQYPHAGELRVIHVNHRLRGDASEAEAQFVAALAERLGWPAEIIDGALPESVSQQGAGLESRLRDRRYQIFTEVAARLGARYLVTGHTRDDQVETILFRALRGTGIEGLSGIPRCRVINDSLSVVRPMRDISRDEITRYLEHIRQDYCTDLSNTDFQFTRNRLRHRVLPELRACFSNSVDESLLNLGRHAENQINLLNELCSPILKSHFRIQSKQIRIVRSGLEHHPRELVVFGLRKAWRMAGLPEADMNIRRWQELADRLLDLESVDQTSISHFPGPVRVRSDRVSMHIEHA